jgi:WD40 repeat protein
MPAGGPISGTPVMDGVRHGGRGCSFVWSADGSKLGTGGSQEILAAADLQVLYKHSSTSNHLSISPDGATALFESNGIDLVDLGTKQVIRNFSYPNVGDPRWLPLGRRFAAVGRKLVVFDTAKGAPAESLRTSTSTPAMVWDFNGAEDRLVLAFGEGIPYAIFFNLRSGDSLKEFGMNGEACDAAAISPNGSLIATIGRDSTVRFWNGRNGAFVSTIAVRGENPSIYRWSPDNRHFAIGSKSADSVFILDALAGSIARTLRSAALPVSIAYLPSDGRWIAIADRDQGLSVYDASDGMPIESMSLVQTNAGGPADAADMIWSPTGTRLAMRDSIGRVSIYAVDTSFTLAVAGAPASPGSFSLSQNYPNPFAGSTQIDYSLGERQPVTITVFDRLGREVARLAAGTQDPGAHSTRFDAGTLAPGIYYYQIRAKPRAISRMMELRR